METESRKNAKSIALVATLAAISFVVVLFGSASDRVGRSTGPELPLFEYADAIRNEDLDRALGQLAPEMRNPTASFVEWELGNRYNILASVVRADSIMDRLMGRAQGQTKLVVVMEIESLGQAPWRATEELPVQQIGDRWYLSKAPLSP